ncbi:AAEL008707-PA [Aedes aegypti]|uniref:AAEL008707-PA n=1 Tax=Aedes aegypti TaxID=7159 RepID=Q16Y00_AEDAE|nr:AAEL008707-PA [Aedes aegypti]
MPEEPCTTCRSTNPHSEATETGSIACHRPNKGPSSCAKRNATTVSTPTRWRRRFSRRKQPSGRLPPVPRSRSITMRPRRQRWPVRNRQRPAKTTKIAAIRRSSLRPILKSHPIWSCRKR